MAFLLMKIVIDELLKELSEIGDRALWDLVNVSGLSQACSGRFRDVFHKP